MSESRPNIGGIDNERLLSLTQRIESLEEQKKSISDDIKDIYTEAKSAGFCAKTLRQVIRMRGMDPDKLREADDLMAVYRHALGI